MSSMTFKKGYGNGPVVPFVVFTLIILHVIQLIKNIYVYNEGNVSGLEHAWFSPVLITARPGESHEQGCQIQ